MDNANFDRARHHAAMALKPEHIADFQRLVKSLRAGCRFQFLVAEYNDANYRGRLIAQLEKVLDEEGQRSVQLKLAPEIHPDFARVEDELSRLSAEHAAIHVLDGENWFDDQRWQEFNIRREAVARGVPICLIFWLSTLQISRLALMAPDLWAWRGGVFSFATADAPLPASPEARRDHVDPRTLAQRSRRIAELRGYLEAEPPYPDEILLPLLDELGLLYQSIGKLDEALHIRREVELPVYEKLGLEREAEMTRKQIAGLIRLVDNVLTEKTQAL